MTNDNARLEQYSLNARAHLGGNGGIRLAGFAAAAGAGLAMSGAADAAIIYSGVQNLSVGGDPAAQATTGFFMNIAGTGIDVDGGGADINLAGGMQALVTSSAGGFTAKYVGVALASFSGGGRFLGTGGGGAWPAAVLGSGAPIGPGGSFTAATGGKGVAKIVHSTAGTFTATTAGNLVPGVTAILGFQLGSGNYGWIRLLVEDLGPNQPFATLLGGTPVGNGLGYPDRITAIDWAYEDSGAAIAAGAIGAAVPAPAPLALLAAGAVGIGAFRRRKQAVAKA